MRLVPNSIKSFKRRHFPEISCSLNGDTVWLSWAGRGHFEIGGAKDLYRKEDGGKLPDDTSPSLLESITRRVHKARSGNRAPRSAGPALFGVATILGVFWLGTGLLYEIKQNHVAMAAAAAAPCAAPVQTASQAQIPGKAQDYDPELSLRNAQKLKSTVDSFNREQQAKARSKPTYEFGYQ